MQYYQYFLRNWSLLYIKFSRLYHCKIFCRSSLRRNDDIVCTQVVTHTFTKRTHTTFQPFQPFRTISKEPNAATQKFNRSWSEVGFTIDMEKALFCLCWTEIHRTSMPHTHTHSFFELICRTSGRSLSAYGSSEHLCQIFFVCLSVFFLTLHCPKHEGNHIRQILGEREPKKMDR